MSRSGDTTAEAAPAASAAAPGPEIVHRVAPTYPVAARRRGTEGSVLLRVEIDADGRPVDVSVAASSGSGLLDDAARAAVGHWRFGGAAGTIDVPITFRLSGVDRSQISDAKPSHRD